MYDRIVAIDRRRDYIKKRNGGKCPREVMARICEKLELDVDTVPQEGGEAKKTTTAKSSQTYAGLIRFLNDTKKKEMFKYVFI